MTLVLIGNCKLREFELLADAAERRGGEAVVCDVREWPGEAPLTVRPGADDAVLGTAVEYDDVTGVYVGAPNLFRPYEPRFRDEMTDDLMPALHQVREFRGLFESLSRAFEHHGATVVPPLSKHHWQDRKAWQLHRYALADLPIPETLFTNDPDEVRTFAAGRDRLLYKPVTRGGAPAVVTEEDLTDEMLGRLATAPVQFQEFVEGVDLRVYVLDGDVVGAIRYDSESFSFKLDDEVEVRPATIPRAAEDVVTRAAELSDLTFAAADLRRRPDGSHVLLELNEMPRFVVADTEADQNVAEELADFLLAD